MHEKTKNAFQEGSWMPNGFRIETKLGGKCTAGVGKRVAERVLQYYNIPSAPCSTLPASKTSLYTDPCCRLSLQASLTGTGEWRHEQMEILLQHAPASRKRPLLWLDDVYQGQDPSQHFSGTTATLVVAQCPVKKVYGTHKCSIAFLTNGAADLGCGP